MASDMGLGPKLSQTILVLALGSPYNWGNYSNPRVDAALDDIRRLATTTTTKRPSANFNEPSFKIRLPYFWLGASARGRSSTRFEVPAEPGVTCGRRCAHGALSQHPPQHSIDVRIRHIATPVRHRPRDCGDAAAGRLRDLSLVTLSAHAPILGSSQDNLNVATRAAEEIVGTIVGDAENPGTRGRGLAKHRA